MRMDPNRRTADGWATITPIPGESLDGLLFDFAGGNFVGRTGHLLGSNCHYASVRGDDHGGPAKLAALAKATGLPVTELESRAYRPVEGVEATRGFFGVTLHRTDLDRKRRLFAPAALAISQHHRAIWQVRALPFCTETWQYLTDTCHRCGKRQSWQLSFGTARCDGCLKPLADGETEAVDPALRGRLGLAAGLLSLDAAVRAASLSSLPPAVAALRPGGVFELLARLVPVTDPALPHGRDADVWKVPAPRLARAVAEAWDLAAGWPDSFIRHASARIAGAGKRYQDGNGGATVRFLRLANDDYVPEDVAALIGGLRASLDLDDAAGAAHAAATLDCMSASYLLGRGTPVVAMRRREGILRAIFAHRGGMPIAMLDRAEIEGIRADMADRSTLEAVSWRLGIPNYGVEQLIALRALDTLDHPWFLVRYDGPQVRTSSIDRFEATLTSGRAGSATDGMVPLRAALHAVGGRLKPWGTVLVALRDGEPSAVAPGGARLADRLLVGADRARWIAALPSRAEQDPHVEGSGIISKKDAGDVLNLAPRQLQAAFPRDPATGRPNKASLPLKRVLDLARRHATHGELAMRSDLSVKRVTALMRRLGHAVAGPLGFPREVAEAAMPELVVAAAAIAKSPKRQRELFGDGTWSTPSGGDASAARGGPGADPVRMAVADVARLSGLTEKQAGVAMRASRGGRGIPPSGYTREDVERALPALRAEAAARADRRGWRDIAAEGGFPLAIVRTAAKRAGCDLTDPLGIPRAMAPEILAEAGRIAGARALSGAAGIRRRRGHDGRVGTGK